MNESHHSPSAGGWKEEWTVNGSLLELARFIQVPIRKQGVTKCLEGGTDASKLREKEFTQKNVSRLGQYEEGWHLSNWRRDHIQKHAN